MCGAPVHNVYGTDTLHAQRERDGDRFPGFKYLSTELFYAFVLYKYCLKVVRIKWVNSFKIEPDS